MSLPHTRTDYYELLGVPQTATQPEIKRAYRSKVRATHPDLSGNGDARHFQLVKRAYEVLGNPAERERYDMINGLGAYAGQPRLYRRSFDRLFDSLLSNLKVALHASVRLNDAADAERRRAG